MATRRCDRNTGGNRLNANAITSETPTRTSKKNGNETPPHPTKKRGGLPLVTAMVVCPYLERLRVSSPAGKSELSDLTVTLISSPAIVPS